MCIFSCSCVENRAGPSNIGNVISQILLCKQIQPDFNQEEICSIAKDSQDLAKLIQDMQEFLPQQDTAAGTYMAYTVNMRRVAIEIEWLVLYSQYNHNNVYDYYHGVFQTRKMATKKKLNLFFKYATIRNAIIKCLA